ncbi:MAG: hypothetical protein JSR57_07565 [Verrucomicrobia bacterium]|nr:hypothetical protein [Verrucomicrobiota bacterium]
MEDKSKDELLEDLRVIIETLKASLPTEAPLIFSNAIDPARALHLREACLHRIAELAESAYDAFVKKNYVPAYLLSRAVMETLALFWYFCDKLEDAIKTQDLEHIREMLSKALTGAKAAKAKEVGYSLDPIHILKLIRHVAKFAPPFEHHYDFLSEVSHPNAAGLTSAYVRIDRDRKMVYFGKEHGRFVSLLELDLRALATNLNAFMDLYDRSAEQFKKFQELCEDVGKDQDLPLSEPDTTVSR